MSERTCLVVCPDCAGTGYGHHIPVCPWCLGGGHMNVTRDKDGGIPDQHREWRGWELGPVPHNPLRLTYEAKAQGR